MTRGRFVTLEGLEGVGKTTNRAFVEARLRAAGHEVVATREPGGTPLGEALREIVLGADGELRDETELLLMTASRVEHVARVIEPALARGAWVLCDRFLDASVAYQGGGRRLGTAFVAELHERLGVTLAPDLTLLLDMPVEAGLERMTNRGPPDRIEREGVAFFERARAAYLERAASEPGRVAVIDASRALEAVQASIDEALVARLGLAPAGRRGTVPGGQGEQGGQGGLGGLGGLGGQGGPVPDGRGGSGSGGRGGQDDPASGGQDDRDGTSGTEDVPSTR